MRINGDYDYEVTELAEEELQKQKAQELKNHIETEEFQAMLLKVAKERNKENNGK